jgi:hypothetical protein
MSSMQVPWLMAKEPVMGCSTGGNLIYFNHRNGNIKYQGHWNRNNIDGLGELYDFYGNSKFKG